MIVRIDSTGPKQTTWREYAVRFLLGGLITAGAAGWPAGVATGGGLRTDDVLRQLRMAAAWAGPVKLDCYLAGNGTTGTTVRLIGAAGRVELALDVGGSGELVRTGISLGS